MSSTPLTLMAYRAATAALSPIIPFALRQRARKGKEDRARLSERLGYPSLQRPQGELIWIHGASIGECTAALSLVDEILRVPERSVLFTSGTVASATVIAERLPQRALHQFAPIDLPAATARFLDHWRPEAALFVDSEIWPNLLGAAHARGTRLALINGRMSARSFAGWRRAPRTARKIMSLYDVCLAQDEESAERFRALGAPSVKVAGVLKADAPAIPADAPKLELLEAAIGDRPVLLAASTHPGEDETVLPAHDALRRKLPRLLTIMVPRHPERGSEIAMLCGRRSIARRSDGALPQADTAVYVADTLGELGLFYRIAPFAFIGGSLVPHGGQNPLEAACLGRAVLAGPHTGNFTQAYTAIFAAQGAGCVRSSLDIVALAGGLLGDAERARAMGDAAARGAATLGGALEKTRIAVESLLAHARA